VTAPAPRVRTPQEDGDFEVDLDLESFAPDGAADEARGDRDDDADALAGRLTTPYGVEDRLENRRLAHHALTIMARLGGMLDELVAIRTELRDRLAPHALMVSARLGGMLGELVAIRTELLDRGGQSDILERNLLPLFAQPVPGPLAKDLAPYEEISPGIRIGFEPNAGVELIIAPRSDGGVAPEGRRNALQFSLSARGAWLSIEAALSWFPWQLVRRYELALGVQLDRKALCRVLLRVYQDATYSDTPLCELSLDPAELDYTRVGDVAAPQAAADAAVALIVVFYPDGAANDGEPALQVKLDYITLHLA
jgi:hypothetical protein